MELTVLGLGTLVAQKVRSCAGYVLCNGNDHAMLDCGPGCLLRLNQADVAVTDISLVLISHFHWDHIAELPALLNNSVMGAPSRTPAPGHPADLARMHGPFTRRSQQPSQADHSTHILMSQYAPWRTFTFSRTVKISTCLGVEKGGAGGACSQGRLCRITAHAYFRCLYLHIGTTGC